jgi:hypothetical protein
MTQESELPPSGMMKVQDAESERRIWIDTDDPHTRSCYANHWEKLQKDTQKY